MSHTTVRIPASVALDAPDSLVLTGTTRSLVTSATVPPGLSVTFTWRRDGNPIMNGSRITVTSTSNTSTLIFSSLLASDDGQYECVLTVMGGGSSANISVFFDLNVTSESIHTIHDLSVDC